VRSGGPIGLIGGPLAAAGLYVYRSEKRRHALPAS
jgi:hypothetical protein